MHSAASMPPWTAVEVRGDLRVVPAGLPALPLHDSEALLLFELLFKYARSESMRNRP